MAVSLRKHVPYILCLTEVCVFVTLVLFQLYFPGRVKTTIANCLFLKIIVKHFCPDVFMVICLTTTCEVDRAGLFPHSTGWEINAHRKLRAVVRVKALKLSQASFLGTNGSQT